MENYDLIVVGAGVAGAFAVYKTCLENKNLKVAVIDIGRPPLKRRRQLEGWFGCLPNSDGKFYESDIENISNIIGKDESEKSLKYLEEFFQSNFDYKNHKSKKPAKILQDKLKKMNYSCKLHNYFQIYPKDVHTCSKKMNKFIEDHKNLDYYFDQEVLNIEKKNNLFYVKTDSAELSGSKVLLSVGRSGWRFAQQIFNFFGIIKDNSTANYGIKCEIGQGSCIDFNKSIISLNKESVEAGKFLWNGTVIQEDHLDLSLSSFRSNEDRWKSEKVNFDLIKKVKVDNGLEESERISKLTFLLANDRVLKEKASLVLEDKSKISVLKEFNWLKESFKELDELIPDFTNKANIYFPTMLTVPAKINIKQNLETDVDGFYVAGESSGNSGLLYSALSGIAFSNLIGV